MGKLILLFIAGFTGCYGPAMKLNRLSLGMNEAQVLERMGAPDSTKASGTEKVLEYYLCPGMLSCQVYQTSAYWVTISSGQVSQFGRAGDWGTSVPFTQHYIIENINHQDKK